MGVITRLREQGVTLIELIIAIVVLGIAAVGILTALGRTTVLNVDPLLRAQSLAVAQSIMDEVTSRPFYPAEEDPSFDDSITSPEPCPDNGSFSSRDEISYICGFDGYQETGILKPNGDEVDGLSQYSASIEVGSDDIDDPPFSSVPINCILRIEVTVSGPADTNTSLQAYRTSYWEGCS